MLINFWIASLSLAMTAKTFGFGRDGQVLSVIARKNDEAIQSLIANNIYFQRF